MSETPASSKSPVDDARCASMARALTEFGYYGVTPADVREQVTLLERGEEPDDVIGMFIRGWLDDAGLLTGCGNE